MRNALAIACTLGLFAAAGCTSEEDMNLSSNNDNIPSLEEFKTKYAHQLDDGSWVVNGDEPVQDEVDLENFYYAVFYDGELIVNVVGGRDDKWDASTAANLTYCVSTRFGSRHGDVVNAIAQGAGRYEAASSRINFVYVPSADGNCTVRNNAVVFSVEPTNDPSLYARAFFPSYSDRKRNVLVNAANTFNGDYVPSNILGHELGHALGFRHEHTRPEAGACFENSSWRPLTPYDRNSIMHYPWCGNAGSGALTWSSYDAQGTAALYGN